MHRSSIASPLEAALFSVVVEDHAGSCALKTPATKVSSGMEKRPA